MDEWWKVSSESFLERSQTGLDAAIVNITADFDPHTAKQGGILREGDIESRAISASEAGLDLGLQIGAQRNRAFDACGAAIQIEFHQPLEMRKNSDVAARFGLEHFLDSLACAAFVQSAIGLATAEELLGLAFGLLGDLHFAICLAVSSAKRF